MDNKHIQRYNVPKFIIVTVHLLVNWSQDEKMKSSYLVRGCVRLQATVAKSHPYKT